MSTLKEAGQSLYDPLQNGKNVSPFQPTTFPLSSPLKSSSTISTDAPKTPTHQAASTAATHTIAGVLIADKYKIIPAIAKFDGQQRV